MFFSYFCALLLLRFEPTMNITADCTMPKGCKTIQLPVFFDDRGKLTFGESSTHIPFDIRRVFWTYDINDSQKRGDHAHRTCSMVIFPLGGCFTIEVDDGHTKREILMDDPSVGILVPPLVWCRLYGFSPNAACVSLASEPYTKEDYIYDYDEFLNLTRK